MSWQEETTKQVFNHAAPEDRAPDGRVQNADPYDPPGGIRIFDSSRPEGDKFFEKARQRKKKGLLGFNPFDH